MTEQVPGSDHRSALSRATLFVLGVVLAGMVAVVANDLDSLVTMLGVSRTTAGIVIGTQAVATVLLVFVAYRLSRGCNAGDRRP